MPKNLIMQNIRRAICDKRELVQRFSISITAPLLLPCTVIICSAVHIAYLSKCTLISIVPGNISIPYQPAIHFENLVHIFLPSLFLCLLLLSKMNSLSHCLSVLFDIIAEKLKVRFGQIT